MQRRYVLRAIAGVVALHGVVAVGGAVVLEDTTPFLRATALLSGVLLLIAAWLLIRERKAAVAFLWLSAAVYVFSIVYPGLLRYGTGVFGVLMATFYWSVGARIAFAVSAQLAFQLTRNATRANVDA
jgi:hypothetical protein